jgi:hypothetical protein
VVKKTGKVMNNKFDELAKGLAQSVTRRQALKRFGVGLAGMALACFGLADKAQAGKSGCLPEGSICGYSAPGAVPCCAGRCRPVPGFPVFTCSKHP